MKRTAGAVTSTIVQQDPAVEHVLASVGGGGAQNQARIWVHSEGPQIPQGRVRRHGHQSPAPQTGTCGGRDRVLPGLSGLPNWRTLCAMRSTSTPSQATDLGRAVQMGATAHREAEGHPPAEGRQQRSAGQRAASRTWSSTATPRPGSASPRQQIDDVLYDAFGQRAGFHHLHTR